MRRGVALSVLLTLLPFALDGCTSLRVARLTGTPGAPDARLEVSVYADSDARDRQLLIDHPVLTRLVRLEGGREVPVARSLAPRWSADELPPGRYRLEATKEIDARGDIRPLPSRAAKELTLSAGEAARVEVLRRKVPVAMIVLAAVTVVALAVVAFLLRDDLPTPPLPPVPPLPFPPVAFDFSLVARADRGATPGVADVFPAPGSTVAARRVAVTFLLAVPLAGDPDPGSVSALGTLSGEIEGALSYLPEEQLLRFHPSRAFVPGEVVTVTLDLSRLAGPGGARGKGLVSTNFRVPAS